MAFHRSSLPWFALASALVVPLAFGVTPPAPPRALSRRPVRPSPAGCPPVPERPHVSLQVTEESGPLDNYTFFFVNENYCDTATQHGGLQRPGHGPANHQLFAVTPDLSAAVLAAPKLSVNFTEQTAPKATMDRTSPRYSTSENVSLYGLWHRTGPGDNGIRVRWSARQTWPCSASAPAPLTLSNLGAPSFAQINQYTTSSLGALPDPATAVGVGIRPRSVPGRHARVTTRRLPGVALDDHPGGSRCDPPDGG